MASPQFNLRLRDGLDQQVRALALQHRVHERDVIEDALIGHFNFTRQTAGVDPHQLRIPTEAPLHAENGAPALEAADQRGDEPRTPRRRGRKDRDDKAGEAGTSGQAGRKTAHESAGDAPTAERHESPSGLSPTLTELGDAALGGPPATSSRGCPECGGAMHLAVAGETIRRGRGRGVPARLTCTECKYTADA